jgi:hypothetical protein
MKTPPEIDITARRHELFDSFVSQALEVVKTDAAAACKLADTALKALSGAEHDPPPPPAPAAASLGPFEEDLKRAYAETKPETQDPAGPS